MPLNLPVEIIEAVLDATVLEPADLASLAAVNSLWLLVARQRLYRTISMLAEDEWRPDKTARFLWTLTHSHVGVITQCLYLGLGAFADPEESGELLQLLTAMPNIRHLRVSNNVLRLAPKLKARKLLRSVQDLEIDYLRDARPSRIRHFAVLLPSLRHVSIRVIPSQKSSTFPIHIEPCRHHLDTLSITQDDGLQFAPFKWLLQLFPQRRELFVHAVWFARRDQANHSLNGVPLDLVTSLTLISAPVDDFLPRILPLLTSCKILRLHNIANGGGWNLMDQLLLYNLVPPNLETIELQYRSPIVSLPKSLAAVHDHAPRVQRILVTTRFEIQELNAVRVELAGLHRPIQLEWKLER